VVGKPEKGYAEKKVLHGKSGNPHPVGLKGRDSKAQRCKPWDGVLRRCIAKAQRAVTPIHGPLGLRILDCHPTSQGLHRWAFEFVPFGLSGIPRRTEKDTYIQHCNIYRRLGLHQR